MAIQALIPGVGYVEESATVQALVPGAGYVNETVSAETTYTYAATGGVSLAGAATLEKTKAYSATGGLTLAGAATTSYTAGTVTYEYTATGGLVLAGAAVTEKDKAYLATGGMALAGAATTSYTAGAATYEYTATGGLTLAGAATTAYQAYQFARPSSDTDAVGWLPSTGTDLYAMIDEVAVDDADYIYTTTVDADAEVALSSLVDPTSSSEHIVRFRARAPYGGQVKVGLYQTTTLVAEWTDSLSTSFETYAHTLAGAEADAITNYGALRLRFTALAA